MVGKPDRYRSRERSRDGTRREWEVFVREETDAALRHVGSITAPTESVAYERATKLFAWYASDVWLCPGDAVARYSTHTLEEDADPVELGTDHEDRTYEA